eukprot:6799914-Prymnesium_polylepis.2
MQPSVSRLLHAQGPGSNPSGHTAALSAAAHCELPSLVSCSERMRAQWVPPGRAASAGPNLDSVSCSSTVRVAGASGPQYRCLYSFPRACSVLRHVCALKGSSSLRP